MLSAKTKRTAEDFDHSEITTLTDVKDGMNTMEFSAVGGLGYLFQSGLYFETRYIYGITNIMKPYPEDWIHLGDDVKNRGFQVSVGFLFN